MDIQTAVKDLNNKILQGKALEAFEEYYDDNVIMQENNNNPTIGKDANRKREQDFFSAITEFRRAEVKNLIVGENVTIVDWFWDYTHAEWGPLKVKQVAVQEWQDGKIIKERFYYSN